MPTQRRHLREGDQVLVPVGDQLLEAELLRFDDPQGRLRADIRFEDGTQTRVESWVLRPAPRRRERWWWPPDHGLRIALITLVLTAVCAFAALKALLPSSPSSRPSTRSPKGPTKTCASRQERPLGVTNHWWGPPRPTFTWDKPAGYVTFNAITTSPVIGDERSFLAVRPFDRATETATYGDTFPFRKPITHTTFTDDLVVHNGEILVFAIYFENSVAANLGLLALGTRVRVALPPLAAKGTWVIAYISARNSIPTVVDDSIYLHSDQPFTLAYQPQSAALWNDVVRGAPMSDAIVTPAGALVGVSRLDGKVDGQHPDSGWVTLRATVHADTR